MNKRELIAALSAHNGDSPDMLKEAAIELANQLDEPLTPEERQRAVECDLTELDFEKSEATFQFPENQSWVAGRYFIIEKTEATSAALEAAGFVVRRG